MAKVLVQHPILIYPVFLVILQILVIALAIGFTSPTSITRLAGLPLVAIAAWLVLTTCSTCLPRAWIPVVAGNGPTYLLRYIGLALLCKWSFETGKPTDPRGISPNLQFSQEKTGAIDGFSRKPTRAGHLWERLGFSLRLVLSPRMVETPYEVRNVPYFSSNPHEVPSRGQFLRQMARAVLISYIIVDLSTLGTRPEQNAVLFAEGRVPLLTRLGDVAAEELIVRTVSTLVLCINVICFMHIGYGIMAFVGVAVGISDVRSWRPPFGSPWEAYTLRRFWGYVPSSLRTISPPLVIKLT